jgi:hypothetical protein
VQLYVGTGRGGRTVIQRVIQRVLSVTGAVAVSVVLAVGPVPAAAAPAAAAPAAVAATAAAAPVKPAAKPLVPTAVKITGGDLTAPVIVRSADEPEMFQSLLTQVNWLSTATPQTTAPPASQLGPKYAFVVLIREAPQQTYDVYPLAVGGPRAFRPARQPTGKKAPGWFYGRLTMSETMRLGGVPLPERPDVVSGGLGGGGLADADEPETTTPELNEFLVQLRRLVLLNGAVVLLIALGLAGISYLVRRRV